MTSLPFGRRAAAFAVPASGLLLTLSLAPSASALQTPVTVSTTSTATTSGGVTVDDGDLVRAGTGPARTTFEAGHWLASAGLVPGDVDGLGRRPGFAPGTHRAFVFTLLSNEGGFLDGDVLAIAQGGGVEIVVAEDVLATALGTPGAALDLDALAYDDAGLLLFSLQDDLDGTVLGSVLDGDVLRHEADGSVTRVFGEADVQARVEIATGSSASIGDVQGLEFVGGEVWVATQAPSASDGAVIAIGATPTVVFDEAAMDLGGAEIDALMLCEPAADLATLRIEPQQALPGATVQASYGPGGAGNPVLVLAAGNGGWFDTSLLPGFGALFMDPNDPALLAQATGGFTVIVLDGAGAHQSSFMLPLGMTGGTGLGGEAGWTFQLVDLASHEVSAPFRIAL